MKITNLNWTNPIGRNEKGQFVSLKNVLVSAKENKEEIAKLPEKSIKILSAIYGISEKNIEIVSRLSEKSIGEKITNRLAGNDPAPRIKKSLTVKAIIDGKEIEKIFAEGQKLEF